MGELVWPIEGRITQDFGRTPLRVEPTMWLERDARGPRRCRPTRFAGAEVFPDVHPGIDIACPIGTPILAPADGKVVDRVTYRIYNPFTKRYVLGLYGMFRFAVSDTRQAILHVDHLASCQPKGSRIGRGDRWARTGNSGLSSGPHAHTEIRIGPREDDPQDSWDWFRWNLERLGFGGHGDIDLAVLE